MARTLHQQHLHTKVFVEHVFTGLRVCVLETKTMLQGMDVIQRLQDAALALVVGGALRPVTAAGWAQFSDPNLHRAAHFGLRTR